MRAKTPFSTLCFLSLALPLLGHGSNIWLFSGSTQSPVAAENKGASPELAMAKSGADSKGQTHCMHTGNAYWDCAVMIGVGYRHDKLSQRYTPEKKGTANREKFRYNDLDSAMGLVRIDARVSNFLMSVEGDYSPLVSGKLLAPFNADTAVGGDFKFRFKKLSGYEADAMASVGYRLPFMNGYHAKAALIFQVGYRYSHQAYETDSQSRRSNAATISFLQDQAPMHAEWFGPFLEARLSVSYHNRFYIQPFYQYHFMDYRAERTEAQKVLSYTGGASPVPFDFLVKFWTEGNDARGQLGGIDLYYQQPKQNRFRIGLKGTYLTFESRETKTTARQKEVFLNTNPPTSVYTKPKFHSHANWESYAFTLYGGYNF